MSCLFIVNIFLAHIMHMRNEEHAYEYMKMLPLPCIKCTCKWRPALMAQLDAHLTGDKVLGSIPTGSGNILS